MQSSEKTLLILLLLVTLFKGIFWVALVPLWHFPDEQAHFAQVQYYAELKKGIDTDKDLSFEIFESERLLGTLRDDRGINQFTYNPNYRIEYSDSYQGIYEQEIANLPKTTRTEFVKREAAGYPPLFYIFSSIGYFLGYNCDLFVRVFLTRIISVLMAVLTIWAAYLLARSLFPKNTLFTLSLAALVSFHPMYTFLSSGINNDNLMIFVSTLMLWLMLESIRSGLTFKRSMGLGVLAGLSVITKQLLYPFLPLPFLVLSYEIFIKRDKQGSVLTKTLLFIFSALIFGGIIFLQKFLSTGRLPSWPRLNPINSAEALTVKEYLTQKIPHLYRETLPWYWGVFKWLGVVFPISILRSIKVVIAISLFGLVKYVILKFNKLKKMKTIDWQLLLIIFSSVWFAFWLLMWDYSLVHSIGFSHGLQGRNFFPNLAGHLALLLFGLINLAPNKKNLIAKAVVLGMIALNFLAMKIVSQSYYQIAPLSDFITQASQYKPWFFKGIWLIFWFVIYITFLAQFLNKLFALRKEDK